MTLEETIRDDPKHWLRLIRSAVYDIVTLARADADSLTREQTRTLAKLAKAAAITESTSKDSLAEASDRLLDPKYFQPHTIRNILTKNARGEDPEYAALLPLMEKHPQIAEHAATVQRDYFTWLETELEAGGRFTEAPAIAQLVHKYVRNISVGKADALDEVAQHQRPFLEAFWPIVTRLRSAKNSEEADALREQVLTYEAFTERMYGTFMHGEVTEEDKQKYGKIAHQFARVLAEYSKLSNERDEIEAERARLETESADRLRAATEAEAARARLEERLGTLDSQYAMAEAERARLAAEVETHKAAAQDATNANATLVERCNALSTDYRTSETTRIRLDAENATNVRLAAEKQAQYDALKTEYAALETKLTATETRATAAEIQADTYKTSAEQLAAELKDREALASGAVERMRQARTERNDVLLESAKYKRKLEIAVEETGTDKPAPTETPAP